MTVADTIRRSISPVARLMLEFVGANPACSMGDMRRALELTAGQLCHLDILVSCRLIDWRNLYEKHADAGPGWYVTMLGAEVCTP